MSSNGFRGGGAALRPGPNATDRRVRWHWGRSARQSGRERAQRIDVYAEIDGVPLLGVAGHDVKAVEYLLGNHVIARSPRWV